MKRIITHSVSEVLNNTSTEYIINMTSLKDHANLTNDLQHILGWNTPMKIINVIGDLYTIVIPEHPYMAKKEIMGDLYRYVIDTAASDGIFNFKVCVYIDKRLKLANYVDQIDSYKILVGFNEKYLFDKIGNNIISPICTSCKAYNPITPDRANYTDLSDLFYNDKTSGIDLSEKFQGRVWFNYLNHISNDVNLSEIVEFYILSLYQILNESISDEIYQNFITSVQDIYDKTSSYTDIVSNYPDLVMFSNLTKERDVVMTHYSLLKSLAMTMILNGNVKNYINYDSDRQVLQIYSGKIARGVYENIDIVKCDINNTVIKDCNLMDCKIYNSKLINCNIIGNTTISSSTVENSFLDGKYNLKNTIIDFKDTDLLSGTISNCIIFNGLLSNSSRCDEKTKIYNKKDIV